MAWALWPLAGLAAESLHGTAQESGGPAADLPADCRPTCSLCTFTLSAPDQRTRGVSSGRCLCT